MDNLSLVVGSNIAGQLGNSVQNGSVCHQNRLHLVLRVSLRKGNNAVAILDEAAVQREGVLVGDGDDALSFVFTNHQQLFPCAPENGPISSKNWRSSK